jgi:SAM-dependent methyltransferase
LAYVHGYSPRETERLQDQSSILENLLHKGTVYTKNEKILEAGCGIGAQTRILARNNPHTKFTSIDISRDSIEKAEETIKKERIRNVSFQEQDIHKMDFSDEKFDHIFVCFVLEHLDDPLSALHELKRVLKTGGSITLIEGDHGSCFWYPETTPALQIWQSFILAQADLGHDGLIGRRLYPLLDETGLTIEDVSPRWVYADNSNPVLLDGVVNKIIVPMVESGKTQILDTNLVSKKVWDRGISDLSRVGQMKDGTFFYTWFKALAWKYA